MLKNTLLRASSSKKTDATHPTSLQRTPYSSYQNIEHRTTTTSQTALEKNLRKIISEKTLTKPLSATEALSQNLKPSHRIDGVILPPAMSDLKLSNLDE